MKKVVWICAKGRREGGMEGWVCVCGVVFYGFETSYNALFVAFPVQTALSLFRKLFT